MPIVVMLHLVGGHYTHDVNVGTSLLGWSGSITRDRYGRWYTTPWGAGIGKAAPKVSGSLTANWMNMGGTPNERTLDGLLSGHGFNASLGYGLGLSETGYSGSGSATGIGLFTPQIGVGYGYSYGH